MKYNTSTKTVYEVFGEENKKYVDLAIAILNNEPKSKSKSILKKRYGEKYDGVGGVRFFNYLENEYLNSALRIIDSYIQGIRVLVEVYKETDEEILKRFQKQNDIQILNMLRILTSNNKPKEVGLLSTKSLILSHFNVSESILVAAFMSLSSLLLQFGQAHSLTPKSFVKGNFSPHLLQVWDEGKNVLIFDICLSYQSDL